MKLIGAFFNLVLLAGATLLLVFIVLSGSTDHFPFNRFYWVRADTSGITGAYSESAWYFWGVCDFSDLSQCRSGPAYPISPVDNFKTTTGVPADFVDNRDTFYFLSRFAFAFFLLALAFSGFALLVSVLSFCLAVIDKVLVILVAFGLFFVAGAASFQTAVLILARSAFSDEGLLAHAGSSLLGITWTAFACMLLVFFITCAANIHSSYKKHMDIINESKGYASNANGGYEAQNRDGQAVGDESSFTRRNAAAEKTDPESGGIRFFRIKRNQKPSDDESV